MKNLVRTFLLFMMVGIAGSIYTSCSDENDCSLAGRPMMYCSFKVLNPDNKLEVLNDTLDSLTIKALGTDSIILNNEKKVSKLMLPLRYTNDSTVFILQYIVQENRPYFQSMECGYMMKQNIVSARFGNKAGSSEKIDSIYFRNKEANSNEIENLQIFFKYRDRKPETTH